MPKRSLTLIYPPAPSLCETWQSNKRKSSPWQRTKPAAAAAIALLERYGVDTVFGIPGVHTLELYRGLADSKIRHVAVAP